ncbi:NADH-quinone oxidoreductase subunit L, partial [Fulvivirga sp. RKSG066]|uniref:NADH-quinone oxidoreductase subunit L n=1 Tax=Fulvivirga aurantia TaxID=2529383 RepID=UPI0012BB700F
MEEIINVGENIWSAAPILGVVIFLLPLLSFIVVGLINKKHHQLIAIVSTGILLSATVLSVYLLSLVWPGNTFQANINWFSFSNYPDFTAGVLINFEAATMLIVVMLISAIVHLYSIKYMAGDEGFKKYFAFLGLFTFSMAGIVIADNLLIIFMFWELVGLSSYLLIGHWYKKDSATFAANKAFIVNRVGDAGFILGLAILWSQLHTLDLASLTALMAQSNIENGLWMSGNIVVDQIWLTIAGICIFLGAVGKSAQFPLQVWLPDAMEGPTPISALIHAATMVAAGVYLMIRVFALLNIDVLTVIAIIGAITAFMGAIAALTQHDIKKVLAYSTISQLGYMLMGIGVGAYDAAYFHLFTHAFFKACLFLSAGSVIYALHQFEHKNDIHFDAQDMRNMGGLRKHLPITFSAYVIATLALIGIPFFSGFLSKDALLSGAYAWASVMGGDGFSWYYIIPDLGFVTVVLTAIYMTRQILLVFFGEFRLAKHRSIKESVIESPLLIKVSLVILAVLSIGLVWSFNPFDFNTSWFLLAIDTPTIISPGFDARWQSALVTVAADNHIWVSGISIMLVLVGIIAAYFIYKPKGKYAQAYFTRPVAIGFFRKLSYYNWYLDPLYFHFVQRPVTWLADGSAFVERNVIDRAINVFGVINVIFAHAIAWIDKALVDGVVNLVAHLAGTVGKITKSVQGGKVQ